MTYTTIFEKLICLFELVSNSWLDIAFVGIVTLLLILLGLKKISKKTCFGLVTLACSILFGYTIYQYFEPLSKMMDSLIDNVFTSIYFPSTYVYLFILLVIDIIAIGNLLNPRVEKIYKTIHGICFIIINFVLTIILEMIAKNNIDIFSKKSLFSNTDLVTLLEFSVIIFILWLVSLFIVYVVNIITERIIVSKESKSLVQEPSKMIVPSLTISDEELEPVCSKEDEQSLVQEPAPVMFTPDTSMNHFLPNFVVDSKEVFEPNYIKTDLQADFSMYDVKTSIDGEFNYQFNDTIKQNEMSNTFDLSSFIPKKQDNQILQNVNSEQNDIFNQILRNELPVIHEKVTPVVSINKEIEETKNSYTLNDYRIFNKMLKDIREHNQSNSVSIDKNLEYRLITKYSTETYQMFKKMLKIYSN